MVILKEIYCKCCGCVFYICQGCYRGQVYCSKQCQSAGYRENKRNAQKKYQNSTKGKEKRIKAAKKRCWKKNEGFYRKLMKTCICIMMLFTKKDIKRNEKKFEKCNLCGKKGIIKEEFPTRPYAKKK